MRLYEKLQEYGESDYYPFHMPGHKRSNRYEDEKNAPYVYDITEIDGFDNLHHPEGVIKESMERAARLYRAKKSYYLVNGSTCGILSAISALMEQKEVLIMARNSHKSAYHAAFLLNVDVKYVYPEYNETYGFYEGISVDEIKDTVEEVLGDEKKIGAVFLTSPTYEGVISDIRRIADYLHEREILLIVDEAHGAHLGFCSYFPDTALHCGADIVIQSLHKTLPALTQSAILHIGESSKVKEDELERYLSIYQTSSPSYVLLSSMDHCMNVLEVHGRELFTKYVEKLEQLREQLQDLKYFKLYEYHEKKNTEAFYDYSKLVIIPDERFFTGKKLYDILLEKYHLQMEMASEKYVIAMTSVYDVEEGFKRLVEALKDMERQIRISIQYQKKYGDAISPELPQRYGPAKMSRAIVGRKIKDAVFEDSDRIEFCRARGKISQEFIYLYPPGVPVLAPGEMITDEIIKTIQRSREQGLQVLGMQDEAGVWIQVVKENWKPVQF